MRKTCQNSYVVPRRNVCLIPQILYFVVFDSSSVEFAPKGAGRQKMHQHPDTEDEYQIVDYVYIIDVHLFEKLARPLKVTINFVALQVLPVGSVYGVQQTVETRTEVWHVKHPAEHVWRIKITYAEAENGEHHRDYWTNEDCELQRITKFSIFLPAYI